MTATTTIATPEAMPERPLLTLPENWIIRWDENWSGWRGANVLTAHVTSVFVDRRGACNAILYDDTTQDFATAARIMQSPE